ncbi:pentapeptide repeat-containing protein [Nocardia jinanensis]
MRLIGTDLYTAWLTAADISRADLSDADLRKV